MRTFEVTLDETIADSNPLQALKEVKGVLLVEERMPSPLTSRDWVRPGRPATDEEIEQSAKEAEQSTFHLPIEEARALTHERFKTKWK